MDNKQQTQMVTTPIKTFCKFYASDKTKNKKLTISLFEQTMAVKLFSADAEGKFLTKPTVDCYFGNIAYNENIMVNICNIMLKKIQYLSKEGNTLESDPIIIHNGKKGYNDATAIMSFNIYSKDGKVITMISLSKKPKGAEKWTDQDTIFLSDSACSGIYFKGNAVELKENYEFFDSLRHIFIGFAERTSKKRDEHWIKVLDKSGATNGSSTQTNSKPNSSSSNNDIVGGIDEVNDDDGLPF